MGVEACRLEVWRAEDDENGHSIHWKMSVGLTFVAANTVSATLIDPMGAVAAANPSDTHEASQAFRSMFVDREVTNGNWTVRFQSKDRADREIILSTWSNAG